MARLPLRAPRACCLSLMIVLAAALLLMMTASKTANGNRLVVDATNLAAKAISETSRKAGLGEIASGTTTTTSTEDGWTFTVATTVQPSSSTASLCQLTSAAVASPQSWSASVEVTWPHMGAYLPVKETTEISPKATTDTQAVTGSLAVSLINGAGAPVTTPLNYQVEGVWTGPTPGPTPPTELLGSTDSTGCAVVTGLSTNPNWTWTVTLGNNPGWVSSTEASITSPASPPTKTVTITPGGLTPATFVIEQQTGVGVTFATTNFSGGADSTVAPVKDAPITVASTQAPSPGSFVLGNGTSEVSGVELFPYSTGYSLWAGDAADANPLYSVSGTRTYGSANPTTLMTVAGQTPTVSLPVYPLTVSVSNPSACTGALTATETQGQEITYTLNALSSGTSATGMPLGQYVLGANSGCSLSSTVYVWVTPTGIYSSSSEMTKPSDGSLVSGGVGVSFA